MPLPKHMPKFEKLPALLLKPVPLFLLRPIAQHITTKIGKKHPHLFARLGKHTSTRYLIKPTNIPLVALLIPNQQTPTMQIFKPSQTPAHDAVIEGKFLFLLSMLDGTSDGDALFFNRELTIGGDTEAVVCLRNALDDVEGSVAADIADVFGPAGRTILGFLRRKEAQ
ncbi:MAG: SCP2 domain-containing protein [Hyphomicrobiales bacterium]|nr:SCP2 domain-containing protein [Hyphomicrobiales bacterium]